MVKVGVQSGLKVSEVFLVIIWLPEQEQVLCEVVEQLDDFLQLAENEHEIGEEDSGLDFTVAQFENASIAFELFFLEELWECVLGEGSVESDVEPLVFVLGVEAGKGLGYQRRNLYLCRNLLVGLVFEVVVGQEEKLLIQSLV